MIDVLTGITYDQLAGATPRDDFTVADLLGHVNASAIRLGALARREAAEMHGFPVRGRAVAQRDAWRRDVVTLRYLLSVAVATRFRCGLESGAVVVPAGSGLVASSA